MCGVRAAVFVAAQVGAGLGGGAVLQRRVPTACEGRGAGGLSWRPWIRVWLGVAGGFLLLAMAWTALFVAADRAQTQFIPVPRTEGPR